MIPKIAAIETIPFRLPMRGSLRWGKASQMDAVEHVLVRLISDAGHMGLAEAPPRPTIYGETVASIEAIVGQHLAPALIGLDLDQVDQANERMAVIANNHTAKSAIDMALHDALAQANGLSLRDWLGTEREKVQVSYILGIADPNTMLAEAQAVVDQGVRVFKVKVGRDFNHDLSLVQTLLSEFSNSDVALYADANECFTPDNAPDRLRQLADLGLLYMEEPLPVRQLRARARLRRQQLLPLIADDSAFTPVDLERELDFDTFDILNIKTARTGYTGSGRMLKAAHAAGKGVMVGSQAGSTLGIVRAALFAGLAGIDYPCELSFFLKLADEIVSHVPVIRDGYLYLDELAEIRLDNDRLQKLRM
jgi:L-alanine-DL-glutamate epimerase-like enolase superfamily enzyme